MFMTLQVTFVGFGEAGSAFASAVGWQGAATAYDRLTDREATRAGQDAAYAKANVTGAATLADAMSLATSVISVVTADEALSAAQNAAQHICPDAYYFDMNSVAPDTKRAAALAIEGRGGCYVDVAVMAPVYPAQLAVPLRLSGPHAHAGASLLRQLGFSDVGVLAGDVGRASSVKMIRSVMIKGIEALTAEMLLAGDAAGVSDEVLASLGGDWATSAAYNLERMTTHGLRRAAEMEEAVKTLVALGIDPVMTRGTVIRQRGMAA